MSLNYQNQIDLEQPQLLVKQFWVGHGVSQACGAVGGSPSLDEGPLGNRSVVEALVPKLAKLLGTLRCHSPPTNIGPLI